MTFFTNLTLRGIKKSALTHAELDNNFVALDSGLSNLQNQVSFISGGSQTLAQTLNNGNTSGAYDILINTGQKIGFKDGNNTYTTYISNNQTQAGNRTVYLPLFDGQIVYHATGSPLTTNYVLKGTTNGAITSSTILQDNGTTLAVNTTTHVSTAALKVKGRLIVSTQEVTANDNYVFMCEVGVGNGVLFSNGTNGATGNNQLGYILGDGGLQIYGRNNASATKFELNAKSSANRMVLTSDDANDIFTFRPTGVLQHTQVVGNDGFNIIKSTSGTATNAVYSALSVINADATANRLSIIGFTAVENTARHAFIGARYIDGSNGDLILGNKATGTEAIRATIYSDGNFGINTSSAATARLQVVGSTSATGAYALKVDNSSNSPLLHIANTINGQTNGLNQGNGNLAMYYDTSGAGYAVLRSLNYNSVSFGTHSSPYRIILGRDGNVYTNDRLFVMLNDPIGSVSETLSVGSTTHTVNGLTSSMVVLNITMGATNSGAGLFAIGATGSGGTTGNATMNFKYDPISYGGTVNSTNNNYYRVAIGKSPSTDYRLEISGGTRIESDTNTTSTAVLELSSTTQGFLLPRMTTAQRTSISSPAIGLIVYQTDATEGLYIYKSSGWTFIA
jgi:hypothetical protein